MLKIDNIHKIKAYKFGISDEWELYGIDYTSYADTYVFEFRKLLMGGMANEHYDIELKRIPEYHNATGKLVYKMNGRKYTLKYLSDINNVKKAFDYTLNNR